jgi:hypothetical protein
MIDDLSHQQGERQPGQDHDQYQGDPGYFLMPRQPGVDGFQPLLLRLLMLCLMSIVVGFHSYP